MSKLNIIEAMKMPIGTEFEVVYNDGFNFDDGNILKLEKCADGSKLVWENGEDAMCGKHFILATFIPIQQPVSFMEAVAKSKTNRFRIEHELLKSHAKSGHTLLTTLDILALYFNNDQIADILLNGKCYIEESEELEDERLS